MSTMSMNTRSFERPQMSPRIKRLWERKQEIDKERRTTGYSFRSDIALGQAASGPSSGSRKGLVKSGATGSSSDRKFVLIGDQATRVRVDYPFPGSLPSSKNGLSYNPINWAEDFAAYLDQSPAEVYSDELIPGEFHWYFIELRERVFPDGEKLEALAEKAARLYAGGFPITHSCHDPSIGVTQGWGEILDNIRKHREKFSSQGAKKENEYLQAAEKVCCAIMRFIERHARKARSLAEKENDPAQKEMYARVANVCQNISKSPPTTFYEAVMWLWFFYIIDRMELEGNGSGRLDQYLYPFYKKDIREGRMTREEARDLMAEFFLKMHHHFSLGGRNKEGNDATNDLSYVCLEAYYMAGRKNEFGVLWHSDIDKDFFRYACAILVRRGSGTPALVNHDILRESEIFYGVKEEDAWNVAYSGCFWYCLPGKEWCTHDMQAIHGGGCLINALGSAFYEKITSFEKLWELYSIELDKAVRALKEMVDWQFERIPNVSPEIVTSLMTYDCVKNGRDITDCGTPYNTTVVQFEGLANIADALIAVKQLVFEEKRISLDILQKALAADFVGYEDVRQLLLRCPKFGNDDDRVDEMAVRVADQYRKTLARYRNGKGYMFRPAFFSWAGHAYGGELVGATPDGRKAYEPIAQGPNPMHGRNTQGITATARSVSKLDFKKNAGGPLQLEFDPSILDLDDPARFIESIAVSYFEMGGVHVFVNVVSTDTLKEAMKHPEEYEDIVIRVTGFSVHFVQLDRKIQEEIIARTRHRMNW